MILTIDSLARIGCSDYDLEPTEVNMIRTTAIAILVALTLAACGETTTQDTNVADLPPCCRKAEGLKSQISPCCRAKLITGTAANDSCCKKSVLTGKPQQACCKRADELIAELPSCCRGALHAVGEIESCCQEWNPRE